MTATSTSIISLLPQLLADLSTFESGQPITVGPIVETQTFNVPVLGDVKASETVTLTLQKAVPAAA